MAEVEHPTIYASVALMLVERWRKKAQELRENGDDEGAALARGLQHCAVELEGLAWADLSGKPDPDE